MSAVFYPQAALQPHQSRSWRKADPDALAEVNMAALTTRYRHAPAWVEAGERGLATDAMTGIQALARQQPPRPIAPGPAERRACAYLQRGTVPLSAHVDIVQGTVVTPSRGPTRTDEDFVSPRARTIASEPEVTRWHVVADHLPLH